jgi:signal transduction histidine kinase
MSAPAKIALRRRPLARLHISPFAADCTLVVALLLVAAFEYTHTGDDGHRAGPFVLNGPLTLAELVPIAWRRQHPMQVFAASYAAVIVPSLFVDHTVFAYSGSFTLAFLLYTVARHGDAKAARLAILGPIVLAASFTLHMRVVTTVSNAIFSVVLFGTAWTTGRILRRQANQRAALADALAHLGNERDQLDRLAVLDERANLARDLHDVVAHAVALMLVQAGAARLAIDNDVEAARARMLAMERAGREATGDLRRLLRLLRSDHDADPLQPAPGLANLQSLIGQLAAAGLEVEIDIVGERPDLAASLNISAFRIIQEALTNVLKHAGPTRVMVRVDYRGPLRLEVVDAGPRGSWHGHSSAEGYGLVGMRERVALFGGQLHAGPENSGFAVRAELPVHAGAE